MYSEEEVAYCNEFMRVVKAFISPVWDHAMFWHGFLMSVTNRVYNSMRSEAM